MVHRSRTLVSLAAAVGVALASAGWSLAQEAEPVSPPSSEPQSVADPVVEDAAPKAPEGATTEPTDPFGRPAVQGEVRFDPAANTIDLHVVDTDIALVLRMLTEQTQTNILASPSVKGRVTASLYRVSLREALDAILRSNGLAFREEGNFVYVFTNEELAEKQSALRTRRTEVFQLHYTPVSAAQAALRSVLSDKVKVETTTTDGVGGTLIINDFEENLEQVKRVLAEVDRRPAQILVEATIVVVSLNDENKLGVNLTLLGGVDFTGLTGTVINPASGPGLNNALNGGILNQPIGTPIIESGYVAGQTGGGGLKLGIVANNVSVFIEALETAADTMVMANPKLLVLDRQQGEVRVGAELYYRSSITVTDGGNTQGTTDKLETGTTLRFTPTVGEDGYVMLQITPEESTGTLVQDQFGSLPQKNLARVNSSIIVKDGHTVVIGGLFRESSTRSRSQAPGLGSLPLIGAAFRSQTDSTRREEILILLTPHIVRDTDALSADGSKTADRVEQMRVSMRRGMMWFGRERLAESWYRAALDELAKPDANRGRARAFVDAALTLNPRFTEALDLRRDLVGKELVGVDNSLTRHIVKRLFVAPAPAPDTGAVPVGDPFSKVQPQMPATDAAQDATATVNP
jgi:type IV pilus secretin PilQ/predicted competence protein